MQDPYSVLGVSRGASAEEIRQAFRRLARDNHPDLHPENEEAAVRFRAINAAFQLLSNPQRRSEFDRFGTFGSAARSAGPPSGPPPGGVGFEELFSELFGGGRGPRAQRAAPLRRTVVLTFEECTTGCTKSVEYDRLDDCARCHGEGAEPGTRSSECGACRGSGTLREATVGFRGTTFRVRACDSCRGTGRAVVQPCSACRGSGLANHTHRLSITIPAGIESSAAQLVDGAGHRERPHGPRGDVELVIEVKPHPVFQREGDDILSTEALPFWIAALGGSLKVRTLSGETSVRVPAGTQHGETVTLKGAGIPHRFRRGAGHQRVTLKLVVPALSDERQRAKVRALSDELGLAAKSGLWGRLRDLF